jgi:arsenical-resistance protein 2
MKSIILRDGITGWAKAGEEYTKLMDDYNAEAWK